MEFSKLIAIFLLLAVVPLILVTPSSAQSSPAQAPTPAGPTNITGILSKAGQFTTLIRLLSITQVGDQINTQLNNSNQGLTIFAPTDSAFSNLHSGTLNSLTDQEKVELVQFHILPSFVSASQFQTASNPLRTQAGNSNDGQFPLNVTTSGNQVNLTTGIVNTTVSNTIYTDGQLAVYQVDQVLLPLQLFGTPAPASAPAPAKAKKSAKAVDDDGSPGASVDSSSAVRSRVLITTTLGVSVLFTAFFYNVL